MKPVMTVTYVAEDGPRFALVVGEHDNGNLDLAVMDHNGAWGRFENVPHGQPGDGATWH